MGRQALLTVVCLLAASETLGDPVALKSSPIADNDSAESAPRLYRNVPLGVYASAAPHGAYSIQFPTFVTAPKPAASRTIPVTEVFQNGGYLKDSYGNRFVESPQALPYKTTFPQQFVQLQDLPAHLSQPIVAAAAPNYQHRQPAPFVLEPHYTYPLQTSSPPRFGIAQPLVYAGTIKALAPSPSLRTLLHNAGQQQSTSSQVVYTNTQPQEQYSKLKDGPKFQRLQEAPKQEKEETVHKQQINQHYKAQLQAAPEETAVTTVVNGEKTVIHLKTKPPLPLLDISLLEPLTFDNPLVPQVQHFLPRINQATYHKLPTPSVNDAKSYQKEFVVMKTKSYDSGLIKGKPQKDAPKKKPKRPAPESDVSRENEAPPKSKVIITGNPNGNPEISYEINSPNYKETYKEQAISYNKETQSEPVHHTYGTNIEKAPVHYSYSHNSEEPRNVKEVHYKSNGQGPTQLIYNFKPEEQNREHIEKSEQETPQNDNNSGEHAETEDGGSDNYHPKEHRENHEHHKDVTQDRNTKPEYREIQYHEIPGHGHQKIAHQTHPQHHPQSHHINVQNGEPFHPITQYEEHIRIVPNHKTARIKVDPSQHVQKGPVIPQQNPHPHPAPQHHPQHSPVPQQHPQNHPAPQHRPYHPPPQHIHEKSRRVIIQEETPEEMHVLREQVSAEMIDQEENNEEDFEKAYKDAAFGFPAYDKDPVEVEKHIYNVESYGVPREQNEYDVEHSPFQQYQEEGDDYPKTARLNYKDERDKTKEDYYLDYSVSKPESLTDRYKNKVEYYKLFKKQKPEYYGNDEKKKQNQNAKYTAAPFIFNAVQEKPKQVFAQYRAAPNTYEYDYSKKEPRDNSAYASRPLQMYKSKTNFVEPQFQYGFEPISLPRLLDSELAAMASNNSPESEKPGLRKKLYKENWYIKKTSTSGGPDSR